MARGRFEFSFSGDPIDVVFRPALTISRGKLLSGEGRGTDVHAGCFIRERRIVLDSSLQQSPCELERILRHEIFHFTWPRLGNARRRSYEELICREWHARAPGELGWSAEWRKDALRRMRAPTATNQWRVYLCESFCDTGAWRFQIGRHPEFTLPAAWRKLRKQWWDETFCERTVPI